MITYSSLKATLQDFVSKKLEYVSLLKQCNQFTYSDTDPDNIENVDNTDKDFITNELKTETFKTKHYKKYIDTLDTILKANIDASDNGNDNENEDMDYEINDDNKNEILNLDDLSNHKSLFKRIKMILKDYGKTFNKKELIPLKENIQRCHNIIKRFNSNSNSNLSEEKEQEQDQEKIINTLDTEKYENSDKLKTNLDTTKIEAVPKNLAAAGDRPDDDNPLGQKIYDLQLIHGFGAKTAEKYVKEKGITLEKLLSEWKTFTTSPGNDDTLMIERLPDDPTIRGVGMTEARRMNARFKYLQDRMEAEGCTSLTACHHEQLIGIKYFYDMCEKIPREEIIKMEKFVQIVTRHINPAFIIGCCGSYRRGRPRSGDMDCLLTHPEFKTQEDIDEYQQVNGNILQVLVNVLTEKGFLTDHLTDGGRTKYMGLCKLPNRPEYTLHRRIDIRFVPYNSYGTALLYFTGSKTFNTNMRNVAIKMGYTLSEYGLFKSEYDKKLKKRVKGEQFSTPNEEDVFKILKMEYKTPKERDI
jgi:DNA polymerase/3'-5' exonuclease PolX